MYKKFVGLVALSAMMISASVSAKDWKEVVIGNEAGYPPFNSTAADGSVQGFDIDLSHAMCDYLEIKCSFVAQEWSGIIPALQAGKFDIIIGAMGITDERKKQVLFSDVYARAPSRWVIPKSADADTSPEAMAGKTIGVQEATTELNYLKIYYGGTADLKLYPSTEAIISDLKAQRVDAIVLSDTVAQKKIFKTDAGDKFKFVGGPVNINGLGMASRLEDDKLIAMFNEALAHVRKTGQYAEIAQKWGIGSYD
ncbi:hypothetical protein WH95_00420 [Kiloniella litopenaei]|uniref:Solute-binding protein family 3/N-terminal domain-containing protein n=1 Tax=Kiloniella litopenaei TaxID=1549748 RepID=A0A0M2R9T3_9PROT|nr:transporter substrate-binding domain-containing protein [Kiloniella litopenaei]KKJ78602.1 hypothetical protein WH95_00420 [Kiloniella litopenaei]